MGLMLAALRERDFRLLWAARSTTAMGTGLLVVAVPAQVYGVTGSIQATGITLAFEYLPALLVGPYAGVMADRWDRRRLMIATNLIHALAISIALLARTPETIWLVYVAVLGQGTAAVIFRPAAQAHTPAVVGTGPMLTSANALSAFTIGVVGLCAPPIGGLLFAVSGITVVIVVDIIANLLAAAAISQTTTRSGGRKPGRNVLADLVQGLRHVCHAPVARGLLATNSIYLLANAALTALLIPFGVTQLGGSLQVGYLLSALSLGFLTGAPFSRKIIDRFSAKATIAASQFLAAGAFLFLFNSTALVPALIAAVLLGLPGVTVLVAIQTWLQRATPQGLLGRASSAFLTMEAAVTMIGAFVGPTLTELTSLRSVLNGACALTALSALLAIWLVPNRNKMHQAVERSRSVPTKP